MKLNGRGEEAEREGQMTRRDATRRCLIAGSFLFSFRSQLFLNLQQSRILAYLYPELVSEEGNKGTVDEKNTDTSESERSNRIDRAARQEMQRIARYAEADICISWLEITSLQHKHLRENPSFDS